MISKLLLQGPSGSGKTSLLLQTLQQAKRPAGGFIVQRMRLPNGLLAYCLTPAAAALSPDWSEAAEQANIFLQITPNGAQFSAEDFLRSFTALTENQPFLILDEIGGIELQLPFVRQRLAEFFRSERILLGVWKSRANLARMIERTRLNPDLLLYHDELEALFCATQGARLLDHLPCAPAMHDFLAQNGLLLCPPSCRRANSAEAATL
ncbi:MAG: ATP-binding protein [Negativicutes bacterium]|nr:ATP-binding protein [Negativicutes bacterium]